MQFDIECLKVEVFKESAVWVIMLIKNIAYLVCQDANRSILQDVDLLIVNGKINSIARNIPGTADIDGKNKIVMPGLVNCHTHIGMTCLRGTSDDEQLNEWLENVVPKERALSSEALLASSRLACQEMILSGTTTFADMYWPPEQGIRAAGESGLRSVMFGTCADFFPSEEDRCSVVAGLQRRYSPWQDRIKISMASHSMYACSSKDLVKIHEFTAKNNLPFSIHLAETRKERFDCQAAHGCLPVEYLERLGVLNERTILVHSVWMTKGEIRIIKKYGAKVVHCPISNMKLASGGVTPLPEMHEEGLIVGLGTDSAVSNNNLDMFEEMKVSGLLHKHHRWDARVLPVQKILDMATIDGARCLGLGDEIGSIEVGKCADVITLDLGLPHMQPVNNLLSNIVYSARGSDVVDSVVNGKILLKDRKLIPQLSVMPNSKSR